MEQSLTVPQTICLSCHTIQTHTVNFSIGIKVIFTKYTILTTYLFYFTCKYTQAQLTPGATRLLQHTWETAQHFNLPSAWGTISTSSSPYNSVHFDFVLIFFGNTGYLCHLSALQPSASHDRWQIVLRGCCEPQNIIHMHCGLNPSTHQYRWPLGCCVAILYRYVTH